MYYDLFDHDTSTPRAHFVNFAAFTASLTLISLRGHVRLLILVPIESTHMTSYWSSIETLPYLATSLPCLILPCFRDIRPFVCRKPLFWYPSPLLAKISGCSPWRRSQMLGSAESRDPKLIFEEFQPMRSRNLNVTDGQTELAVAIRAIKQCYICIFYNLMLWTLDNQLVSAVDRFRHNILSVSILYYVTSIVFW